jgi:hypothetical protein
MHEREPAREIGGLDAVPLLPIGRERALLQLDRNPVVALEVRDLAEAVEGCGRGLDLEGRIEGGARPGPVGRDERFAPLAQQLLGSLRDSATVTDAVRPRAQR